MDSTTCDLIAKDKVIRLAVADQDKVAAVLVAPPRLRLGSNALLRRIAS